MSNEDQVSLIRRLYSELASARQDYDFQPPSFVSHVDAHAGNPLRLRRYARQVINGRIMILLSVSRMNTQRLLQTYVEGLERNNPFPLLLAARTQLELYVVIADTTRLIRENSGEHAEGFVDRVRRVDHGLIKATFGTRSTILKELMSKAQLSKLRQSANEDFELLTAQNILTRLSRVAADSSVDWKGDYEQLCEYVHPNWGMNLLLMVPSPVSVKFLRFSNTSKDPFERAVGVSSGPMLRAATGTLNAFDDIWAPFGEPEVVYPANGGRTRR